MTKVKIVNEGVVIEIPEGARFADYAKENSNMLFGCENAECATCLCTVIKGKELLNEPAHKEWLLLKQKSAYPNQRLGCQIYVKKEGVVEIEY
ncbi:(2Fe-2S)-binding protein [Candidatus Micrarchaeota archaeon]|nr:(2Fe-2S)-binding protein [Candidatus Micrarchaeota archaeon]